MALKDKIVLITASARGIGKGTAIKFARQGARLYLCDISEEHLLKTKAELENEYGEEVGATVYDARKPEDIEKVSKAVIDKYGDIDILINNAGIAGPGKPVTELTVEDWDETLEINLRSPMLFVKHLAPYMIKKSYGKIINVASITGKRTLLYRAPYCASKIGLIGLTRELAEELGPYKINVNAVCPSAVNTDRMKLLHSYEHARTGISWEDYMRRTSQAGFIKGIVESEDVGDLICFLCDDELSAKITGQDFNINLGITTF